MTDSFSTPSVIDGPLAVVGDLHGADHLLERLLARLRAEDAGFDRRWLVFAGDFLDRGRGSRRCLDLILDLLGTRGRVAACMGNHDLAACGAMRLVPAPESSNWAMRYAADYDSWPTFASYGVEVSQAQFNGLADAVGEIKPYYDPNDESYSGGVVPPELEGSRDETLGRLGDLLARLREAMPERHKRFLSGLPWCVEHPNYLAVHAGLTDEPFARQLEVLRERDFTLGRPPWLHSKGLAWAAPPADCPLTVVSGHVVVPEVRSLHGGRRILVDTFGGYGDFLSAILLPERRVVTSRGAGDEVRPMASSPCQAPPGYWGEGDEPSAGGRP